MFKVISSIGKTSTKEVHMAICHNNRGIGQNQMDCQISEYLWRKDRENRGADLFQELIEDIR